MTTPNTSALFPDRDLALTSFRADMALGGAGYFPPAALTDDLLWGKLLAAEAEAERLLNVFFSAVEVIPDNAPQSEIDALDAAGTRYVQEAAFDFEQAMFLPNEFGMLQLGHRPVQAVHSVIIKIPSPFLASLVVPNDWIRLTKKYGAVRFYPTSTASVSVLGSMGIGFMSGGTYPNVIEIRYISGLKNAAGLVSSSAAAIWPDLIEVVKKMAILNMLNASFPSSSESISADGLSQSKSVDTDKWQGIVDVLLFGSKGSHGGLYTSIHGVTMGVMG